MKQQDLFNNRYIKLFTINSNGAFSHDPSVKETQLTNVYKLYIYIPYILKSKDICEKEYSI